MEHEAAAHAEHSPLAQFEIDPGVIKLVPADTAQKYQIVPLSRAGATLTIAMTDPTNVFAMDDIKFMTGYNVEPVVASETAVIEAIARYYGKTATAAGGGPLAPSALEVASKALEDMPILSETGDVQVLDELEEISAELLAKQGEEAPVVRLVNVVLMSAIQKGASDIHIEPYEKELRVRYRIDGLLYNIMQPPMKFRDAITSRIKIMSKLDIAEKRLPQDGRIKIRFQDNGTPKDIDFRVSCLPTLFGEKIVMRLLDKDKLMLDMTKLGFEPESLAKFESAIARPWGMVLVTGPTGSGKSTTLATLMRFATICGVGGALRGADVQPMLGAAVQHVVRRLRPFGLAEIVDLRRIEEPAEMLSQLPQRLRAVHRERADRRAEGTRFPRDGMTSGLGNPQHRRTQAGKVGSLAVEAVQADFLGFGADHLAHALGFLLGVMVARLVVQLHGGAY